MVRHTRVISANARSAPTTNSPTPAQRHSSPWLLSLRRRAARIPLFWRFQLAGWTAHAVLSLPIKVAAFRSLRSALLVSLVLEPVGLLLTWGLRHAYRHLALRPEQPGRLAVGVLACGLVATAIDWATTAPFQQWLQIDAVPMAWVAGFTWLRGTQYVAWSFLYFWIKNVRAARERAMNLIRAEAAAREAEVRMLRAQIDPHFLFNALNTVLAGIPPGQRALSDVVQGLADYLRYSLAHRHLTMVPLGEEFDAALNYLTVEKARFRDDLLVEAHIDESARSLPAPGVFLQPLIENAVKHGYKSSSVPLRLQVSIRSDAMGGADIDVTNSGRWIEPPVERAQDDAAGHGLESVKRRLALLYPGAHRFELSTAGEQVSIRIHLPPASSLMQTA